MNAKISKISPEDYNFIINELNNWWGGRKMTDMLPRLFFKYFTNTSFIVKDQNQILGFIIGFISQDNPKLGYVHFIGVNPEFRKLNLGKKLYAHFFKEAKCLKLKEIECVTSIKNKLSINFHKSLGFSIQKGNKEIDGISYFENYDGINEHRVLFKYEL
ncbi:MULTISPECIES: GNAT family N-acetyltransferase [Tenacibaculum]|uniref:GNAT family N-acetyltransferase n=1 Tax=Tenacibaculum TaxID=104267 RepID=UPI000899B2DD|nr:MULTISPECIES: GNAT family N-acetyltransferase [unclassified Tenacibaculum]RBW56485.1 GNAT family N-acetyltransferase [Tenacibaculum sp. E3R01]SEE50606.1 Acetyltransferase (GNAT) family protein [Tenacibaculum sp. MAR_2010_89]